MDEAAALSCPTTSDDRGACSEIKEMSGTAKPFKLPSIVNLYEAAESQLAEQGQQAEALTESLFLGRCHLEGVRNLELKRHSSHSSGESNSDTESQQTAKPHGGTKKVSCE